MSTTSLYIELVIIGFESIVWMCSFATWLTEEKSFHIVMTIFEKLPATVIIIGLMYIVGTTFDRFAKIVFKHSEEQIKKESGLSSSTSMMLWKKNKLTDYLNYSRSKIRILRASALNIPIITISLVLNIIKYYYHFWLAFFVIVVGIFFSVYSFCGLFISMKNYYSKAQMLEQQ